MDYQTVIKIDGNKVKTLADILPTNRPLKMLIVAKVPAPDSVSVGHYFQGQHGKIFWGKLKQYGLLTVPPNRYEDEVLLDHGYGLTDIVKVPRGYGSEPSMEEYRENLPRIQKLVKVYRPGVLLFVYKGVLDKILKLAYGLSEKAKYGYNPQLDGMFGTKVFTFPMPGTRYGSVNEVQNMSDLAREITG